MAKLPITDFLTQRLQEYDPKFEVRKGTGFAQLFFNPVQYLVQPIVDEANRLTIAQSFLRILQQPDPDAFSEEAVDSLASNLFVTRSPGSFSGGSARVYYPRPVAREWPANGAQFTGSNGKLYTNSAPYSITQAAMSEQIIDGTYYADIPIISVDVGEDTALEANGIVSIDNDTFALSATNLEALSGGSIRETNTALIERVQRSISVRDLVTGKGFNATMFDNFITFLTEIQPVGFGDAEMMRDIVYNTHIGGKVDGYFKTTKILQGFTNFVGVMIDETRQGYSSTNLVLYGLTPSAVPDANFDTTGDKFPIVEQIKTASVARYLSPVDMTSPLDLSTYFRIKLTVDGIAHNIDLRGSIPSTTARTEILNKINQAFGTVVAYSVGISIELRTPSKGLGAELRIEDPDAGPTNSALLSVFGLPGDAIFYGTGPIVFTKDVHYSVNDFYGTITRIVPTVPIVSNGGLPMTTGAISLLAGNTLFTDATTNVFLNVAVNDIITINPLSTNLWDPISDLPTDRRDVRIIGKTDNNTLTIDTDLDPATGVSYVIRRTGIKDGETVYVQYWFNPLSVDIGPLVQNIDTSTVPDTITRGIRPGREDFTITDVALLRINQIDIIDPISLEPTGEVLATGGGYGQGGYGAGPYGSGGGYDYRVTINSPTERFSAFEDAYIVFHPGLIGLSFRVSYDYVPECMVLHDFVRSESERVLDADILMKHFLPAYVGGEIHYSVDSTDTSIPDNETLTSMVKDYINRKRAGTDLEISEIYQFIMRNTDVFDRYGTYVQPFTLTAVIHNTDGTTTMVSSDDKLVVPTPDPFPKDTTRPLSPRITHWIGDNIVLVRDA